jgi:hypothetical protein
MAMIMCWAIGARAQQAAGAITGTVTDESGAAVANATVSARDVARDTNVSTVTNSSGVYEFPQIPVGTIEMKVSATGFGTQVREAFALVVNQVARIDFQLKVGQVSQTVEVTEAPPLLQTDTTDVGMVMNEQAVVNLPLASRNVNQFTLLSPGVTSPNVFAFEANQNTFGTGRPYVNGAREQDNNFSLDGMDINQADNNEVAYVPSPDAIQDFNLIAGNAPADFGNYIGGVIVETLKSGTNSYHGDVFEFLRNTSLDANSWQNNATGAPRSPLHYNNFGGTVGGPIIKNKLFFFADYEGARYSTPASSQPFNSIPAAYRTGDFSSICTTGFTGAGICTTPGEQLYDPFSSANPATRTPYPNNQVPVLSAAAKKIFASPLFPGPGVTSYLQQNYINSDQGDLKLDWQASNSDHIMARYSQMYVINNTTNSIQLLPDIKRTYPLNNEVVDWVHTISPSLVNDARVGLQVFPADDQVYTNPSATNLPATLGIPGVQATILPLLNFGTLTDNPTSNGLTSVGSTDSVEIFHDTTVVAEDSMTWTHGKHVTHFGFEYFHYIMNDVYPGNEGVAGSFSFSGQFTGNTGATGGVGVADFILGLPTDVTEGTPLQFHLRNSLFGGFLADSWRIKSNLTINLGLRYEVTTARGDSDSSHNVNFNLATGAPEIGKNYDTYSGIDNVQPRIGFAWQPGFAPNTVVRGAYGISTYMEGNGVNNLAVVNPPYVVNRDESNVGLSQPLTTLDQGYNAFPAAACTAAALEAFSPACLSSTTLHATNPHLQPAVDQQWNFTIQHQFGRSTTFSVGYVGNKIDHMSDIFIANQGMLVNGAVVPSKFAPPLIAAGATVRYNDSEAVQRYNALELTLTERAFHGLEMQANYTWSKCLSNSLGYFGQYGDEEGIGQSQTNGGYFFFQNIYDQHNDIGRCITDVAGAFNGYMVYDLPFGRGRMYGNGANGVVNQIIGGWSVASSFNIHSGFAISPAAPDNSGTGGGVGAAYRPNCVAGVSQFGSGDAVDVGGTIGLQFLNPAAVREPAAGTFGNCGVGAFRGPSLAIADFNIIKAFPVTENVKVQFMAQFLNLTNTPIFGAPQASCGPLCDGRVTTGAADSGTFGIVQSTDPGREIQFGLKLIF